MTPLRIPASITVLLDHHLSELISLKAKIERVSGNADRTATEVREALAAQNEFLIVQEAYNMLRAEAVEQLKARAVRHFELYGTAEFFLEQRFSRTSDYSTVGCSAFVSPSDRYIIVDNQKVTK